MSRRSSCVALGILSALVGAAILAAGAATRWAAVATAPHPAVTSTPSLRGLAVRTDVMLPSGRTLCVEPVALESTTARAVFIVSGPVRAGGLRSQFRSGRQVLEGRTASVGQGEPRDLVIDFTSPRRRLEGALCVTNRGKLTAVFVGTTEPRSMVPAVTSVGGRPHPADVALTLLARGDRTLRDDVGESIRRASTLTGGALPPFALWGLVVLAVLAAIAVFPAFGALVAARWAERPRRP